MSEAQWEPVAPGEKPPVDQAELVAQAEAEAAAKVAELTDKGLLTPDGQEWIPTAPELPE